MAGPDYQRIFEQAQEQAERDARPGAVMRCFADIEPETLKWLWPARIPLGKLTLLIGDPGLGKSLLTLDISARISRGGTFPDGATCEMGSVLLLSAEDDVADTVRPRLDVAGANVCRVHTLEAVRVALTDGSITEKSFSLESDITALDMALREHPDVRLVVINPISAYLGGTDSHVNSEVRGLLSPLAALASKYEVAVVCVTHLRKSAGPAVHRAIGSIGFAAAARASWAVGADPSDAGRRLFLPVKQNLAPDTGGLSFRIESREGLPGIAWDSTVVTASANDVLNVLDDDDHSARRDAESWLRDFLADGPAIAGDAIQAAGRDGIPKTTLRRAALSLGVSTRKTGGRGGRWEWSLEESTGEVSKKPNPIYQNVVSLDSLTTPLKTQPVTETENSKKPKKPHIEGQESLPLLIQDSDEEVRL